MSSLNAFSLRRNSSRFKISRFVFLVLVFFLVAGSNYAETPKVGGHAPDFTLSTPQGQPVKLSDQSAKNTVVLVILRGYPGYQCPFCQKQVHDFITHAPDFAAKKASVLLVYPGPPAQLDQRAKEFLANQSALPSNITLVLDPDYSVTNLYDLRWNAPDETAYPSTFILDKQGTVLFAKISREHGDRTTAADVLAQISAK